jgi:hypothetical protein
MTSHPQHDDDKIEQLQRRLKSVPMSTERISKSRSFSKKLSRASYKSVVSEQDIRKDERNKVLDELQEFIAKIYCDDGIHRGWLLVNRLDRWIADKKNELSKLETV